MRWRDFDHLPPLPDNFFDTPRRVHFVGIGGIGMSALAFVLRARGHHVSGSDVSASEMLEKLRAAGVETVIGHRAENLDLLGAPAEAVIFGSAVRPDNPERAAAAERGIVQWHRAQLLAYFVNNAQQSIAVSGTHGKSTTSAMIAHILTQCDKNPTAILGAVYPPFGSNVRIGDPDLVVVEADESDGSFTLLRPTVAVVTNVEPEHLENYDHNEDELYRAFVIFISQTRGHVALNRDDEESFLKMQILARTAYVTEAPAKRPAVYYYATQPREALLRASDILEQERRVSFTLHLAKIKTFGTFHLSVPGQHNVSNALGASLAVWNLGIDPPSAAQTLSDFHGVARRFEFKGEANDIVVYDDYGHHPTEVRATLEAARDFLQRPVLVIFQPHRYSRTQRLGRDFGPAFAAADRVIVTQLYSAFEEPIEGVSGRIVFDAVCESLPDKPVRYAEDLNEARQLAREMAQPGDAIITMGAGDISTLGPLILQDLQSAS
ncbi:MAG: UDP-N-acetylmuramate--L-alanine ligase [Armatimonadota bacterium]|nr:UDP-N-acetylmuramate--L-alanine ligase [Armatimonadota bacterium]